MLGLIAFQIALQSCLGTMVKKIGIILNGATGRICSTQHLANSLVPITRDGFLTCDEEGIIPDIILLSRDTEKLKKIAKINKIDNWTNDVDAVLSDPRYQVFFDGSITSKRPEVLKRAIQAGKHIYSEKPVSLSVRQGREILKLAEQNGLKHGAVEDKIHAPGFRKLIELKQCGFFGDIVGFKLDFGWWVFDGFGAPANRSSWNYRSSSGGGIFFDMFPHWRYVVEMALGPIKRIMAVGWTAQAKRKDEQGNTFEVDVEDSGSVILELQSGVYGTITSSWAQRVRGEDIVRFHIDGIRGSAESGIRKCYTQGICDTPSLTGFNFMADSERNSVDDDYLVGWKEVLDKRTYINPYRVGWEDFLRHIALDLPLDSDFASGIRDVQLAEACVESAKTGQWVSMGLENEQ